MLGARLTPGATRRLSGWSFCGESTPRRGPPSNRVAGNPGLEGVCFFGGADLGFPCVAVGGGAEPHSLREGEESVVPVRTEGRALVPPIRGGAGARAVVEKGAGRARAKAPRLCPRPYSLVGGATCCTALGPRVCETGRGSRRVAFRARRRGGVKPVFPRLSGIRLAGRRVRGCDATPLPPRPRRDFRLLSSEAELGKARCRVWRGVIAPRLPRPAPLWVGGLLVT